MNVVLSKKFRKSWNKFISYALDNYGETIAKKKRDRLSEIVMRLSSFPEIGFIDPYLENEKIVYRVIMFEKKYKLVYKLFRCLVRYKVYVKV